MYIHVIVVLRIPGKSFLPKSAVEVGPYYTTFRTCATLSERRDNKIIDITCHPSLRGRSVKITTLRHGSLAVCQVAVYARYG